MKKYIIKFEYVQKYDCESEIEANSYEEAMDLFEEKPLSMLNRHTSVPFKDIPKEEPIFHVSSVTENDKEVYKDIRKIKAELTV
mgnify:FL=1